MAKQPQTSVTIPDDIKAHIADFAKTEHRSVSEMIVLLLDQAVKNRLRKRKKAPES